MWKLGTTHEMAHKGLIVLHPTSDIITTQKTCVLVLDIIFTLLHIFPLNNEDTPGLGPQMTSPFSRSSFFFSLTKRISDQLMQH